MFPSPRSAQSDARLDQATEQCINADEYHLVVEFAQCPASVVCAASRLLRGRTNDEWRIPEGAGRDGRGGVQCFVAAGQWSRARQAGVVPPNPLAPTESTTATAPTGGALLGFMMYALPGRPT